LILFNYEGDVKRDVYKQIYGCIPYFY